MSKSKMTPGPWWLSEDGDMVYSTSKREVERICNLPVNDPDFNPANAQAIAALPDLIDALKACITHLAPAYGYDSRLAECLKMSRQALKKAGVE